jgi:microcystin degradation protein MlrC
MSKLIIVLSTCLILLASGCDSRTVKNDLPRIAIAGIAIESSTFSPAVTHEEAFRAREIFKRPKFRTSGGKTLIYASIPGEELVKQAMEAGVDQDLMRLPYERVQRPIYPLDPDMEDPDLSARFIPSSDKIRR